MISDAPVTAAEGMDGLGAKVQAFIATAQSTAADGLTVQEFGELVFALVRLAVNAADTVPVDGPSKKSWVLDAVGILFDATADSVVSKFLYPLWLLFRRSVRTILLFLVSGAIEALLPLLRSAK